MTPQDKTGLRKVGTLLKLRTSSSAVPPRESCYLAWLRWKGSQVLGLIPHRQSSVRSLGTGIHGIPYRDHPNTHQNRHAASKNLAKSQCDVYSPLIEARPRSLMRLFGSCSALPSASHYSLTLRYTAATSCQAHHSTNAIRYRPFQETSSSQRS